MEQAAETRGKTVFHFAVLVYREEIAPGRPVWFARSVMTSDLASGATSEEAVERLHGVLEAALSTGVALGMSPRDWLAGQKPDQASWIEEWIRYSAPRRVAEIWPAVGGCEIEANIAWTGAA
jgi:hypothetical protein